MNENCSLKMTTTQCHDYQKWVDSMSPISPEIQDHYENCMCLKVTSFGPDNDKAESCNHYLSESAKLPNRESQKHLCVLPKGHTGKCKHKFTQLFKKTDQAKKLLSSIDLAIYSTPGNDDYVHPNRASRLHANVLSSAEAKKIRDKTVKKKCAIPLKDATSPLLLAQAALDWLVILLGVPGVKEELHEDAASEQWQTYLQSHKAFLKNYYDSFKRVIFDEEGHTICCITRHKLTLEDVADMGRDVRVDIRDTDLQMGHNIPRSDEYITIRGCNLLPMTRRGNLIIGEKKFTENAWIDELKAIVSIY
jgi:hypothetical protein